MSNTATPTPVVAVEAQLASLTVNDTTEKVATIEKKKLTILDDLGVRLSPCLFPSIYHFLNLPLSDDDSDDEDYQANEDGSDSDSDDDDSSSSSSSGEENSDSDKEDEIEGDEVAALARDASAHGASLDVEKKVLRTGKVLEVASTTTSTEVVIEKVVEETVVKAETTA
ncbi:MAG: hypothetical protein BYD32DRAFT_454312 [Podila humilis]|nr:MAG: hypothetical protein BYD32DRAFT_454312 [Podila humilis]